MRHVLDGAVEAQISAHGEEARDLSRPDVGAGVDVARRQLSLREHIAEGVAESPAGGIHVTLAALGSLGEGEVRLGVRGGGGEQPAEREAEAGERGEPGAQGAPCTVNSLR